MDVVQLIDSNGRGGGIRTPGPLLPKQMRYQAALRPDIPLRLYRESISESAQPPCLLCEPHQKPNDHDNRNCEDHRQRGS